MSCFQVRSKTGALSIFRRVTVCTETVEATDGEDDRVEMEDKEPETRRIQDPQPSLLDQVSPTYCPLHLPVQVLVADNRRADGAQRCGHHAGSGFCFHCKASG